MIIITGHGRSGTRVVAEMYQRAGFRLSDSNNMYFDDLAVLKINLKIASGGKPGIGRAWLERHWRYPRVMTQTDYRTNQRRYRYLTDEMEVINESRQVSKHCSFNLTLDVWINNGVIPEHVIIVHRDLDDSVTHQLKHDPGKDGLHSRNKLIYGYGKLFSTLLDNEISHTVIKFPQDMQRPRGVKIPGIDDFDEAVKQVFDKDRL